MKYCVRAQWIGPDGRQMGVAADVEARDACDALDCAWPSEWRTGEFTGAVIAITPLPSITPPETSDSEATP